MNGVKRPGKLLTYHEELVDLDPNRCWCFLNLAPNISIRCQMKMGHAKNCTSINTTGDCQITWKPK